MLRVSSKNLALILGVAMFWPASLGSAAPSAPGLKQSQEPTRIAVTVDDIPEHGDLTPGLTRMDIARIVLKALKDNHITQAYGFLNGYFMRYDAAEIDIAKAWLRAGYPLGNHTYEHADLERVSARVYIADIEKLDNLLRTLSPPSTLIEPTRAFRYPYLHEGDTLGKRDAVRNYLAKNSYRIAEVTIDYHDWAWTDAYTRCVSEHDAGSIAWLKAHIVDSAERHLRDSQDLAKLLFGRDIVQILLIHVGVFDAIMLDAILSAFRKNGVRFVTLEEALADPAYAINPNHAYTGERTFLEQVAEARNLDISAFTDKQYTEERMNNICKQSLKAKQP